MCGFDGEQLQSVPQVLVKMLSIRDYEGYVLHKEMEHCFLLLFSAQLHIKTEATNVVIQY